MVGRVNDALNKVFLDGRFDSRPLYLVLDNSGRNQLAELLGVSANEVEELCCREVGRHLSKHGDPYSGFQTELWRWVFAGRKTLPPFTALLFTLSHAAEQMVSDEEFTAGNYYNRLSALVNVPSQRLSQYGRSTEQFWKAFNGWLADKDFTFGRPTARAVNSNKYVGIAMSQAIVREADRQRFHSMFEKYGFSDTDAITETEIEQYISTWIGSSLPTRQLKAAWKKTELRSRICEAALSELETWQAGEGRPGPTGTPGTARLSLALAFRHDLTGRSVSLYFGREQTTDPIELDLDETTKLEFSNTTFAGFATLEPRSSIPIARSLLEGIHLSRDGAPAYQWKGRPAIPLSRSDQGYWTEISRVSLGVEHIVLVRDDKSIRKAIESALEEAATPGYTIASQDRLKGLPPGWVLYEKVIVHRALAQLRGFEAVLSPVGETASLRFEGGMKLGRGIWHLWCPPTVHLDGGKADVFLGAWKGTSAEGEPISVATNDGNAASLVLAGNVPEGGNVYIEGKIGKSTVATASLLFRSANRPRPRDRSARAEIAYTGILTTQTGESDDPSAVRGMLVVGDGSATAFDFRLENFTSLPSSVPCFADDAPQTLTRSSEAVVSIRGLSTEEVLVLPCAVRGLHRLKFATVVPGTPKRTPVDVECLDCGITYLHRPRVTAKSAPVRRTKREIPESQNSGAEVATREIDYDLWLDGACFLGSGPASVFETFAASAGVDTWRAGPALRDLVWLGHVDVETGATHRPKSWSVSPPAIYLTSPNRAVISGFRCRSLIDEINDLVSQRGGQVEEVRRPKQPTVIAIEGLEWRELADVASKVRDPHGRAFALVDDAPGKILSFLREHAGIDAAFRPVSLGSGLPVQRFDAHSNRWRSVDCASGCGAYRVYQAGTSYVFLTPSGRAYSGPRELVKLAAARTEGVKLHAYDPSSRRFSCPVGCEPAGLLGRALVACSGELPSIEDRTVTFCNIPPAVAAGVLHFLYDGDLPA